MNDFGSSLFKIQSGVASMADVLSVFTALVSDERARQRCAGLSGLVADLPESERKQHCESMASVYFYSFDPPKETLLSQGQPLSYQAQVAFIAQCCPPLRSKWEGCVRADYNKNGKPTRATISTAVAEVLQALEALWGVPEHLVVKR